MSSRNIWVWCLFAMLALSFWAYGRLPEQIPTHFDINGTPDNYSPKLFGVLLLPVIVVAMRVMMTVLPRIDPRKENYEKFEDTYWILFNWIFLFMAWVHFALIGYSLELPLSVDKFVMVGLGFLFLGLGNYLTRVEPNWFVGIRTPWTIASDTVWRKTHRVGGWCFAVAGLLAIVTQLLPVDVGFASIMIIVVAAALFPVVYSYVLWTKEKGST